MKAQLAVLRTGGLSSPTMETLVAWMQEKPRNDWMFTFAMPDADVARARSIVATDFLHKTDADVLVMMDYDIQLRDVGDLDYLAEKANEVEGIVGAVVPVKGVGQGFGCRFVDGEPHELFTDTLVELKPPAYMGGALTAYHRSVFEELVKAGMHSCPAQTLYPFFMPCVNFNEDLGEYDYLSEDWAICCYAHDVGKKVYAAMKPLVMHHGKAIFTALISNGHETPC